MTELHSDQANAPFPIDPGSMLRSALAVFVKTPGLSPIKTRLSAEVGEAAAATFYQLAVGAVEATLAEVVSEQVQPFWAVAEEKGLSDDRWQRFPCVSQGEGDLGDRLDSVFENLQSRYEVAAVMGVDSPQVSAELLKDAFRTLVAKKHAPTHVLGRCHDGGFYYLATNVPLPSTIWHEVEYSSALTAEQLSHQLAPLGEIVELPHLTDVDRADDFDVLRRELEAVADLRGAQQRLADWLAGHVIDTSRRE